MRLPILAAALLATCSGLASAQTLRVMTFNVRMPSKSDGANVWENRRDILVAAVRDKAPDIFGTQELFDHQGRYIAEKAPEYAWFGRSRRGNHEDEHMGVFYKKDKLRLVESGDFWLSETPETPGSMSWDVSLPRMVTWGLFEVTATGRRFYFYNTHLAHRQQDQAARVASVKLIADRIAALPKDVPLILTGDFNTGVGSEPYRTLEAQLKEAWATAPARTGPTGTFHGFSGKPGASRIDWIWYRGRLRALAAETVTYNRDGRYPSDHFPIFAEFEFAK
jgi:endonuclease/exonuclease/phosphatase family metal-dependent hydrolase